MIKRSIILLLLVLAANIGGVSRTKAEVLARDTMACKNWEWLMEVIWLTSLSANGEQNFEAKNQNTTDKKDEWIKSGRCAWFTKGLIIAIVDTLPLATIQARPAGSLQMYTLPSNSLLP
jgi:hypothetical protein